MQDHATSISLNIFSTQKDLKTYMPTYRKEKTQNSAEKALRFKNRRRIRRYPCLSAGRAVD
jgi:hypothetical protein